MKRRAAVLGGAAAAAALTGGTVAWWRGTPGPPQRAVEPVPDFWTMRFERPAGGAPLAASALRDRPLLVNFWATWCPPCVTEMPLLDAFWRRQGDTGWHVLALAVESAAAVRDFIEKQGLGLPVALSGNSGVELSRSLGNAAGGLPYTVGFDARGEVSVSRLGAVDEAWLAKLDAPRR